MVCIPLKHRAKYTMAMETIIMFDCNREDGNLLIFSSISNFSALKILYQDHFYDLLGHLDYGYFYTEHYHQQIVCFEM